MIYLVRAKHPTNSDYDFDGEVKVGTSGTKFYADARGLGCGKDRPTPEGAIRELMENHALRITYCEATESL